MHDLDAHPKSLLTVDSNPKLAKGEGWLVAGLHLAPHKLAGVGNLCSNASPACIAACLNTAGHGGIGLDADGLNIVQVARIRRTRYFKRDRQNFLIDLADDIARMERRAFKLGVKLAVRLNVLSDLPWENIKVGAFPNMMALFPLVQFYDYTKVEARLRVRKVVGAIPNYHLTFSLSEINDSKAEAALVGGTNVAVVFDTRKGKPLPATYRVGRVNAQVLDGDQTDLRFLDAPGLVIGRIIGLRAKGRAKHDTSGFVRAATN